MLISIKLFGTIHFEKIIFKKNHWPRVQIPSNDLVKDHIIA